MKSKKKIAIIAGIIALVVLSAGVIGAAAYNNMDSVKLKRQMDLGQRYLEFLQPYLRQKPPSVSDAGTEPDPLCL